MLYAYEEAGDVKITELKKGMKAPTHWIKIKKTDLPDRSQRHYWKIKNKKVVIDKNKQLDEITKAELKAKEMPTLQEQLDAIMEWAAQSEEISGSLKDIALRCVELKEKYK